MAETIEIDINARDNTSKAIRSVSDNFRNLGRQISGIGGSMSNIFTRPLMDLERFLLKNSEVQAALEPAKQAWQELGNELATSLVPVIKDITPALISLAGSLSEVIKWFSSLDPATKDAIVGFVAFLGVIGPVLTAVGQLITFIGSLGAAWTSLSGAIAPLVGGVLPAIGGVLAGITLPVWGLIAAIGLLVAAIVLFGKDAWNSITMLWQIWTTTFDKMIASAQEVIANFINLDWGGAGQAIMQGIANGITSGWNWVVDAARNAATAAFDAAKNALGIHSPSVVFEGIGMNMMKGMASGINQNAGLPSAATTSAATGSVPATSGMSKSVGGTTIVYSPAMSLASEYEFKTKFAPLILEAIRGKV